MRLHATALAVALTAFAGIAQAAPGDLDPTFGLGGRVTTDFNLSTDIANAVALQADGKLVVVGTTYTNNDYSGEDFAIARYNPDGSIDSSFGTNGRVTTDFPGLAAVASSVLVQPDGKILVAGGAYPLFVFLGNFELARYNADGSLDTSFGDGGIVTTLFPHGSYAFALALQSDGKVVAAGTDYVDFSSEANSDTDFAIARYEPDGSPDFGFGSGGQVTTDFERLNDDAFAVLLRSDGSIVAVGSSRDRLSDYDFAVARYLANGQLDPAFGTAGKTSTDFSGGFDRARSAVLQADGRIVAAGFAIRPSGSNENFAALRYLSNGALDTSFSGDGMTQVSFGSCCQFANKVLLQRDAKLVLIGFPDTESTDSDFTIARLNRNGTLDASFGEGGRVRTSFGDLNGGAYGAVLQPDGRVVAVGFQAYFPTPKGVQFALARYLSR